MFETETDSTFPPQSLDGVDDVVIVGGGLAGLFCALRLAPRAVTVLTAAPLGLGGSSARAQAGIAAALAPGDSIAAHLADTIAAGAGLVEPRIAELMVREASARIHDLLAYGVPFDRDLAGHLAVSREAAHSAARVVGVGGDKAGMAIMQTLVAAVRRTPSIRVVEGVVGESLLHEGPYVTGVVGRLAGRRDPVSFRARAVVLAAGGIGHLYAVTTNPPEARGDGIAMAARAGAAIADAEFVQFHPTAIAVGKDPAPLATESLRGAGAVIIDETGDRFLARVHAAAELAPRDVVARAIHNHLVAGHAVFLDGRTALGERFAEAFPTVFAACMEAGIDPAREPIPIAPAAHYHMGGVMVDANGRSTLEGLWVCGESASTGAHGANRLASNSLLEAVVFAARIADDISGMMPSAPAVGEAAGGAMADASPHPDTAALTRLRQTMTSDVGVVRSGAGMARALGIIARLEASPNGVSIRNPLTAAKLIAASAFRRTESRGAHFRSDYPLPDPHQAVRSHITLAEADRIVAEAAASAAGSPRALATAG